MKNKVKKMLSELRTACEIKQPKRQFAFEKIIQEFGLIFDPNPGIYGAHNGYMNKTREELGVYQTPPQFAQLLDFLYDNAFEMNACNSYLEVGVFRGGSFLFMGGLLSLVNSDIELYAVETNEDYIHPDALPYIAPCLIVGGSENVKYRRFDIVLIDGDHSYTALARDYYNVGRFAKICIIHDINEPSCPDVKRFWDKIKVGREHLEFIESGNGVNTQGIGVIINTNPFTK
jgi:hypothetical protein